MNVSVYFAVAITAAFLALYIKQIRPDYALLITLGGVILLLSGIIPRIALIVSDIQAFASIEGVNISYITPVLKIIGISYLAQFAADICIDAGERALATHVETLAKITNAFMALPIVEDVFSIIIELLE